jgi:alpha/beta superfamily hydrolase
MNFAPTEPSFLITAPAGELELLTTPAKAAVLPQAISAVVCHPHPLFGGTMNNKVVSTIARTLADLGISSVRFNFRGVGQSTGVFDEGIGEQDDLLAVIDWVKAKNPQHKIWLGGFSFGAAISAHVAARIPVSQLICIAPPVPRVGLMELAPVNCPWLVVQGDADEVVVPQAVYDWVATRDPKPELIKIENAGHFFHGQLMELRRVLEAALISHIVA